MPNTVFNDIDTKLMHAFVQFNHLHRFAGSHDMDKTGKMPFENKCNKLRFSEYSLLYYIRHYAQLNPDGVSSSEISVFMNVKPPTINPLLTNLEKAGLIERKTDQNDRRFVRIKLSTAGVKFTNDHEKAMLNKIHGLAAYLGDDKSNTLAELMNDVYGYFANQHS